MKNLNLLFCIFVCVYGIILNADSPFNRDIPTVRNFISQSYMATRPAYQRLAVFQPLWHDIIYTNCSAQKSAWQIIGMYADSSHRQRDIYYFFPSCREELLVAGDDFLNTIHIRDVRAEWLSLPSDFKGFMTIRPQQKQACAVVEYHKDLCDFFDIQFLKDYWISIIAPIVYMQNNMHLTQAISHHPDRTQDHDGPYDIRQAFCQPSWNFARICGTMRKTQWAELRMRLGKAYLAHDGFELIYFSGLSIPTSQEQQAYCMFYPVTGFNGHLGIELGFHAQLLLSRDDGLCACSLFVGLESMFLVHHKQYRTFDLIGKPWSRYLLFNRRGGPTDQNISGVNVLTRRIRVHPYTVADFVVAWRMKTTNYEMEVGYNVWGHGNEKLEFTRKCYDERFGCRSCCMLESCNCAPSGGCRPCRRTLCECGESEFGIAGQGPIDPAAPVWQASSACKSTIMHQAENDPVFIAIKDSDLDLYSGAARTTIIHSLYASLGRLWDNKMAQHFVGGGVFVDIPQQNSVLAMWGVWFKGGATF